MVIGSAGNPFIAGYATVSMGVLKEDKTLAEAIKAK